MSLRHHTYLLEVAARDLYADGHWITYGGKPLFIGGAQRKRRPKKPSKPAGKIVVITKKDGSPFTRRIYSQAWTKKQSQFKFAVMASLAANVGRMKRVLTYESEREKQDLKKATATALRVMLATGMRVGQGPRTGSTKGQETFGTTSLRRQHVKIEGDRVVFDYRGKAGVQQRHEVIDNSLSRAIRSFMDGQDEAPDDSTPLFLYRDGKSDIVLDRTDVAKRLRKFDKDYKPKDLRTLKANEIASTEAFKILDEPLREFTTKREKEKFIKAITDRIAGRVAETLGNTKSVAKANYINPSVINETLKRMGLL